MEVPKIREEVLAPQPPSGKSWANLATPASGSGMFFLRSYVAILEVNTKALKKGAQPPYIHVIGPNLCSNTDQLIAYPPEDPEKSRISTLESATELARSGFPTAVRRLDGRNFSEEDFSDMNQAMHRQCELTSNLEIVGASADQWMKYAKANTEGVLDKALEDASYISFREGKPIPHELGQTILSWSIALGHCPSRSRIL